MNIHTYLLALIILISGCVSPNTTFEKIPPGIWRAVLMLDRKPVQEYGDDRDIVKKFDADAELPFNFEVVYDNDSIFHLVIFNAEEKIVTQNIRFGRDKATGKDHSVTIQSSGGLSKQEIDDMIKKAEQFKEEDAKRREMVDLKNEAHNNKF